MLGQPAARRAFVPHPVQDRTDDELRELAQSVVDELLGRAAAFLAARSTAAPFAQGTKLETARSNVAAC